MIKRNQLKSTLFSLVLLGSILGACSFSSDVDEDAAGEAEADVQQVEVSQQKEQPFDELTPEEFFEMCEEAGGQVEQWGNSWACDFETEEDITCNGAGECNFGTVPEIGTAGYTIKQPRLAAGDNPDRFVARCGEAGGVFFEWQAGFGCDFEERMDVFCVPEEDDECGLGWVTELTDLVPEEDVVSTPAGEGGGLVLVAQVFEPAFQQDAVVIADSDASDAGDEFVLAKQFLSTDFFTSPASNTDNNVAKADDSEDDGGEDEDEELDLCDDKTDTGFECRTIVYDVWGDFCAEEGGDPTFHDQSGDLSKGEFWVTCDFPTGGENNDWKCDRLTCEGYETPLLDFGGFEDAFQATQVFIVLAGPSDIDQGFLDPAQPGNDLYVAIVEMNGIMGEVEGQTGVFAPINLPGTVTIDSVAQESGSGEVVNKGDMGTVEEEREKCEKAGGTFSDNSDGDRRRTVCLDQDDGSFTICDTDRPKKYPSFDECVNWPPLITSGQDEAIVSRELLLKPNQDGDALTDKICGVLTPQLCWPEVGLLIPTVNLVYYVSVSDIGMPEQFTWVGPVVIGTPDILDLTATFAPEEVVAASGTPAPQATSSEATQVKTQAPKATQTDNPPTATDMPPTATSPPPSATPIPPDPMTAKISGKAWNDANGNKNRDTGEGFLPQTSVKLGMGACNATGFKSAVTGFTGGYSFTSLAAGTYCVSATRSGSISSPTTTTFVTVVLSPGQTVTVDFGFQKEVN